MTVYGAVPFVGVRVCVNWAPCDNVRADAPRVQNRRRRSGDVERAVLRKRVPVAVRDADGSYEAASIQRRARNHAVRRAQSEPGGSMDRFVQFV